MKAFYILITVALLSFSFQKLAAQDLTTIAKQKPVTVSGGLGLGFNAYQSTVYNPNNSPFGYTLNGSVNISLYGLYNIPITVFMTNLGRGASLRPAPLTNLGFAPTYKRFTFYGGWNSVQFSQYTLAGAPFVGGGLEYKGKWLRLGAVYGQFQKAYGDTVEMAQTLGYQRMGLGAKLGFGGSRTFIDFTFFKAKDDTNSLKTRLTLPEAKAKENIAIGSNWRLGLFKNRLVWESEVGISVLSKDMLARPIDLTEASPQYADFQKVYQPRLSSALYHAASTSLGWQGSKGQIKFQYRRVSKDYQSLGALYVQNNLENYTLNTNFSLFKSKLRFNMMGGIQHDELPIFGSTVGVKERLLMFVTAGAYASKLQTELPVFTYRRIGSGSMSFNPTPKYGLDLSFSNFLTDQQVSNRLLLDTARTAQATTSFMVMNRFTFVRPNRVHNIIAVYNYSLFDNNVSKNPSVPLSIGNNTISNVTYSLSFPKKRLSTNLNLNYSHSVFATPVTYMGAMIGATTGLFKGKISTGANIGYGINETPTRRRGNVNFSVNASAQVLKKQSLNLSIIMLRNEAEKQLNPTIGEFRGTIGYNYAF
jgi:hypothetical protein